MFPRYGLSLVINWIRHFRVILITNQLILGKASIATNYFPNPTPSSRLFKVDARRDIFTVVIDTRVYKVWRR